MEQAKRWAQRARDHARVLAQGIGPRAATSQEERQAAEYVRDELRRWGLHDVRLEPFRGSLSTWLPWAIALSVAGWATLIGLLFDLVGGVVAALLYLVAAGIIYHELDPSARGRLLRRRLWQAESQNVLGVIPSVGRAQQRVVLLAYLDTAQAPFFWRTERRRRWVNRLALPLALSLPFGAVTVLLGALTGNVWFYLLTLLCAIFQSAALVTGLLAEHSPYSPGANNNGAGIGTLLALAERLKDRPLQRTEVWILATGCRESGAGGLKAFLQSHGEALSQATFVALEGVGIGERVVYLTGEGLLSQVRYPPEVLETAARAAERCRHQAFELGGELEFEPEFEIKAQRHRGSPTEVGLLVRRGFKGNAINVWPTAEPGPARRRRLDDSVDNLEIPALAHAHVFAWTLLQEIDRDKIDSENSDMENISP